jgi:hypothetical protein
MSNLDKLAEVVKRFTSMEHFVDSLENYDGDCETVENLTEMLSNKLECSNW